MYYSFTVPIPKAQGKITRMKKGNLTLLTFHVSYTKTVL